MTGPSKRTCIKRAEKTVVGCGPAGGKEKSASFGPTSTIWRLDCSENLTLTARTPLLRGAKIPALSPVEIPARSSVASEKRRDILPSGKIT